MLTVARTDTVRIFVDVPEMDSPLVEAGRAGYVSVQALPDRIVEGKVARTSWVLGANRTLHTELDLPNPNGLLRPECMPRRISCSKSGPMSMFFPLSAIVRDGKQAFCWVVKDGVAKRTPITTGLQVGADVEVTAGLKGDEQSSSVASRRTPGRATCRDREVDRTRVALSGLTAMTLAIMPVLRLVAAVRKFSAIRPCRKRPPIANRVTIVQVFPD